MKLLLKGATGEEMIQDSKLQDGFMVDMGWSRKGCKLLDSLNIKVYLYDFSFIVDNFPLVVY